MSHPRKIYIDTEYKTKDSVSSSDFKTELPETVLLPENVKLTSMKFVSRIVFILLKQVSMTSFTSILAPLPLIHPLTTG